SATRRLISWPILFSFRTGPRPPAPAPTGNCSHRPVAGSFHSTLFSGPVTETAHRAVAIALLRNSIYRHHIAGGGGGKRGPMNGPKRGRRGTPGCGWPE